VRRRAIPAPIAPSPSNRSVSIAAKGGQHSRVSASENREGACVMAADPGPPEMANGCLPSKQVLGGPGKGKTEHSGAQNVILVPGKRSAFWAKA
jgi:hypothetical protein